MKPKKALAQSDRLIILYKTMFLIRHVELTLARIFADGEVPGFIHLCIGQEAVAAGVTASAPAEAVEKATERKKARYRESEHVKKFYATNRY
jgi:pyruvate dehydrogenase E1 component alpha subunit